MSIAIEPPSAKRAPQSPGVVEVDWDNIITEDDEPVDNELTIRQMDLWKHALRDSREIWAPDREFIANANMGVFRAPKLPPIVPDFFLSMDVAPPEDLELRSSDKSNRSYFIWIHGKAPDLVMELVSNKRGGELGSRMTECLAMGVRYYVLYDPSLQIQADTLVSYELIGGSYRPMRDADFPALGLGLKLVFWDGEFEGCRRQWLRWAALDGTLLAIAPERAAEERNRADGAEQRAEDERRRADEERRRADEERRRADEEHRRAEDLAARLRELGVDPGD